MLPYPDASYWVSSQMALRFRRKSVKNRFFKTAPRQPSCISERNDFSYFWPTSPRCFLKVSSQLAFWFRRISEKWFWISDRNDFSYAPIPRCFLLSFKSIGPSVQEKKRKIDFHDGRHGSHLGFPIEKILAILINRSPRCFLLSFESIGLRV